MVPGSAQRSEVEIPRLVCLVEKEAAKREQGHGLPRRPEVHVELRRCARAWYFHRFYDFQPDLNTSNPEVQAEILKIMGFWIQQGVCGFRMDAVPFVIATKGANVRKPVEQYDMLRLLREFLQWRRGDSIILAEANVTPDTDMKYFGKAGER